MFNDLLRISVPIGVLKANSAKACPREVNNVRNNGPELMREAEYAAEFDSAANATLEAPTSSGSVIVSKGCVRQRDAGV